MNDLLDHFILMEFIEVIMATYKLIKQEWK